MRTGGWANTTHLFLAAHFAKRNTKFAKGNGGLYRYYRCTRKHGACAEKYIQESELQKQIIEKAQTIALPADWSKEMLEKLEREEKSQAQSADAFAEANKKRFSPFKKNWINCLRVI